ncbi:MAG: TylF/MycF family methyltransferase [Bacteroidales bacterium]|nr:TylF/MycF family methyltransferase [Bacteroidales bacterium]
MNISVFQVVQFLLIAVILLYLLYYVYTLLFDKNHQPRAWKAALKSGNIPAELQKAEAKYPDKVRFFNFWFQVERLKKDGVRGAFAELGVYKGDSAHFIHLMDEKRSFHLFDTFEGFQENDLAVESGKAATYTKHNFADTSVERVKQRLTGPQFVFHEGYFPETAKEAENEQFAMVSMDADLYKPTKAGLDFFYPRLAPGGVLIVHDYNPDWPGIVKAVDEFAQTIPEPIVPLVDQDNSVMIFKVGSSA